MTHALTSHPVELKLLDLHPSNVRVKSPETYEQDNIAHLAASIAELGLLHPLIIQKDGKTYGVLAGGRRLAALKALAKDKAQKGFTNATEIPCRIVPKNCDLSTAISLAENITQAAMKPIDEYEAFARILEVDGQDVETIAKTFGTTQTAIKERLRYGLVHPEIREAVRAKDISLDVMKAFANHPAQDVQLEVFKALREADELYAHKVRSALKERGVQVSDDLGAFVFEDYTALGGAVAADLLAENSMLEDRELVEAVLENRLRDLAEAERARLGFAWADAATTHDWQMFQSYGRVYKNDIEPDAKAQARLDAIAAEVSALEERQEAEDITEDEYDQIYDQIDTLTEEADDLQTAYSEDDLARAGVFATWNGSVQISVGLVRPEEKAAKQTATGSNDATNGNGTSDPDSDTEITLGNSLLEDLRVERAMALGLACAQNPKIASDLAMFKLVQDAAIGGMSCTHAFGISASPEHRSHSKMDEIDQNTIETLQGVFEALELEWCDEEKSPADQFAAFRALKPSAKDKLVAYALGMTIKPCSARNDRMDSLMFFIEPQVMPDIRAIWTPNAAFFARLKKADLLRILSVDLGLVEEANNLGGSKKNDVVAFCDTLFAEPFATLTEAQRSAVASWCPSGMQTNHPEADTVVALEDSKANSKAA